MVIAKQIANLLTAKADALVRQAAVDLKDLLHPDFVYVNASGVRFDRAGYVDFCCTSGKIVFSAQAFADLQVTPFVDFAVATTTVHDRFSARGREVAATYRSLCVFCEVQGRWQWAAGQTMAVRPD
jgi:hypothetical protein